MESEWMLNSRNRRDRGGCVELEKSVFVSHFSRIVVKFASEESLIVQPRPSPAHSLAGRPRSQEDPPS